MRDTSAETAPVAISGGPAQLGNPVRPDLSIFCERTSRRADRTGKLLACLS